MTEVEKLREALEAIESVTSRANRDYHGHSHCAFTAHEIAASALAALPSAPVGECEACGGCGYEVVSVAECCNRPTRSGECCCNPVEGQKQEPCSACGGSGKIPAPVPGFVMVPVEPTEEMFEAGESAFFTTYTGTATSSPDRVWKAMLAAAPASPASGTGGT